MDFKHTQTVQGIYLNNEELAERIGDLYYYALADLLSALSNKINADCDADLARGRKQLAQSLHNCAKHLELAAQEIDKAWDVCKPYIEQWKASNGSNRLPPNRPDGGRLVLALNPVNSLII